MFNGISLCGRGALCGYGPASISLPSFSYCLPSNNPPPAYKPSCSLIDSRTKRSYSARFSR